jgi:hypothetical protein
MNTNNEPESGEVMTCQWEDDSGFCDRPARWLTGSPASISLDWPFLCDEHKKEWTVWQTEEFGRPDDTTFWSIETHEFDWDIPGLTMTLDQKVTKYRPIDEGATPDLIKMMSGEQASWMSPFGAHSPISIREFSDHNGPHRITKQKSTNHDGEVQYWTTGITLQFT